MESKENINFIFQLNNKSRSGNFFVLFITGGVMLSAAGIICVAFSQYILLIAVSIVSMAYIFVLNSLKPSFFEMLVTAEHLQVNYYSVASTFRSYQSVDIPLPQLVDFQINRRMGGIKSTITLSVQSKFGIADYPPISISLLSKSEIAKVVHVLNEILKTNNVI